MTVKRLITCDCLGTQTIDSDTLAQVSGLDVDRPCSALCTKDIARAADALAQGDVMIACQQEAGTFEDLAAELDLEPPAFVDLRDRAGWTEDSQSTLPKMSALLAEARLPSPATKTMDVSSDGVCLIFGPPETALAAADQLKDHLGVTVLLPPGADIPKTRAFDVIFGHLKQATGAIGGFDIRIDALQQIAPGGRGAFSLTPPQDGGRSACDVILDLSGAPSLFPAPEKRDGYLRADPKHPPAVAAAILAASHLTGVFEKPLYVQTEPLLCAHSRAEQTGCTRCLDLCPTGAITPKGDHVTVDPKICAGCGACSAACPSGAISYDAPPVSATMARLQTLAKAFLDAGGHAPRLLVVDAHGAEMIRLAARFGRGLPADVLPLELDALGAFGHAEAVAARAAGFAAVYVLAGPGADIPALTAQVALAQAIAGADRVALLDMADPDMLADHLYANAHPANEAAPVRPVGTRRQITRQAAKALSGDVASLPLPEGAPYGAVLVNTDACTLCLSCVSLCPSGALGDNPDRPQLRFQEDACLQCGLCAKVCPEDAIGYEPRLNLEDTALDQIILHEEEPFACIECGALFGVKSTVERVMDKLSGHSMFAGNDALKMIQMCDTCRVNAQYHSENNPFAGGERPRPRTTDDYLSKRRDH